ncbi:MAG: Tad domain-containing protein, partial [Selenomonadaceae bacterium]|nr:Tad domain-containing protein [Selenomonadaceae bacterium]
MNQWKKSREKGYVLVFFGLALLILLPCVGLAIDFGRAYLHRSYLQNVADAAALAGVAGVAAERTHPHNAMTDSGTDENQTEYRRVRLIPEFPEELLDPENSSFSEPASEEELKIADDAANPLLRENTKNAPDSDGAQLDMASKDENLQTDLIVFRPGGMNADKDFYYKVEIREAVQFLFAQVLIPESLLPHWTVGVVAWATTAEPIGSLEPWEETNPSGKSLYDQMNEILTGQTPKTFYDLPGNGVQEKRQYREGSVGIYYRLDENGNPTRTEYFYPGTVMPDEKTVNKNAPLDENGKPLNATTARLNQRYLFIDFKPDVSSPPKLPDGWDLDSIPSNLSYGNLRFNGMKNSWAYDTRTQENVSADRWGVIPELMKRLLGVEDDGSPAALEAREKVMALLNTRIESIITFDRL